MNSDHKEQVAASTDSGLRVQSMCMIAISKGCTSTIVRFTTGYTESMTSHVSREKQFFAQEFMSLAPTGDVVPPE